MKLSQVSAVFFIALYGSLIFLCPNASQADQQSVALLNKVQDATEAAKTLTADFTYTTTTPSLSKPDAPPIILKDSGTVRLMKPNFADISFDLNSRYGRHIVSDGAIVWTYFPGTNTYTQMPADHKGKNINVWRLITIGGFFSVYTWIHGGVYVGDLSELTYAGKETIDGTEYQVIEHKMVGTIQGKDCPFDQKIFIGSDNLIHRFTLALTLDGKPGMEVAELTNIKTGQVMTPQSFVFTPPAGAQDKTPAP